MKKKLLEIVAEIVIENLEKKFKKTKKLNGEQNNKTIKRKYLGKIYADLIATVYKGNIIKNLIMDCQSYTKYRPNETTGGIFVSWRRKEELPTGA